MEILGYTDRWSIAPDETLTVFVSCREAGRFHADIVRLLGGPTTEDAFSVEEQAVGASADGWYEGGPQVTSSGSYAVVHSDAVFDDVRGVALEISVWPTMPNPGRQTLMARRAGGRGFSLLLKEGHPTLMIGNSVVLQAPVAFEARRWYRVKASIDVAADCVALSIAPAHALDGIEAWSGQDRGGAAYRPASGAPLIFAASLDREATEHFNGKLEAPALFDGASQSEVLARWDFSRGIETDRIEDIGPRRLQGRVVNLPLRAVTGPSWTPDADDWRQDPAKYGAIHFHADDLSDARWRPSFSWVIPEDLPSGVYAVRLKKGEGVDRIPFFVRPRRGTATVDIAVLLPTATYMAYANDHQAFDKPQPERSIGRPIVLQPQDLHLHLHRDLGLSLYDRHADGSGVHHSSRLRPVLTMRPLYRRWDGADGVGLRWFGLDLLLIGWLNRLGRRFDVLTDEDLDREGADLLSRYRVVLTGNQPEYASACMLDALETYTMSGGRLMYLGGNGFYWRVAFHPSQPGVIELRRGHDGAGAWVSASGEARHAFTGEAGGTWRTLGRPPQRLVGIGFVAEGFTRSGPYERTPGSDDPAVDFVFDGVDGRRIGTEGLSGGGAAGIEIDRTDPSLGTPTNAVVLACAAVPSVYYAGCTLEAAAGGRQPACAEMVLFTRPGGGAVFSTGSIAWIGALPCNGDVNAVSRVTANVLRRFLDSTPLTPTAAPPGPTD
ncbi:MAG: N,N-dimethylformamidase [Alphaproteobacteria bacterium]|nr:N,N-dimethylformamidase [Alphaproteobacteria bacterium]